MCLDKGGHYSSGISTHNSHIYVDDKTVSLPIFNESDLDNAKKALKMVIPIVFDEFTADTINIILYNDEKFVPKSKLLYEIRYKKAEYEKEKDKWSNGKFDDTFTLFSDMYPNEK